MRLRDRMERWQGKRQRVIVAAVRCGSALSTVAVLLQTVV